MNERNAFLVAAVMAALVVVGSIILAANTPYTVAYLLLALASTVLCAFFMDFAKKPVKKSKQSKSYRSNK